MQEVIKLVSEWFGLTEDQIRKRTNRREIVEPRQIAAWILRNRGYKLMQIANALNISHCTVIWGHGKVENMVKIYPEFRKQVELILSAIDQENMYICEID